MKAKATRPNKFIWIITTPFRALAKARDFYVRSMINCANRNIVGLQGTSQAPSLPRSFSATSARSSEPDEDYRELIRASSARNIGSRVNLDAYLRAEERKITRSGGPRAMPPRSISVAMGRIDEDRPCCYFGDNFVINGNNIVNAKYPRSRSHAVSRNVF